MAFSFLGTPGFNPQAAAPNAAAFGNLFDYQDPAAMGLLASGAALLQAGAPSTTKQGLGAGIGSALMNFVQGQNQARRANLTGRLLAGQVGQFEAAAAKQRADAERATMLRQLLTGGATTPASATAEAATPGAAFEADAYARSGGAVGAPIAQTAAPTNAPGIGRLSPQQLIALLPDDQIAPAMLAMATKEEQPLLVTPGTAVLDRRTGKPIFTNPKNDDLSSDEKLLRAMGLEPGTPAYQKAAATLFQTKGAPLVSLNMGNKADELLLGSDIKRLEEAQKGVAGEMPIRQRLGMMVDQLLSGTETGPSAEWMLPLKNFFVEQGLASPEQAAKWGDQELFRASAAYLVPRMRVAGSGSSSDLDISEFRAAVPGLAKSPNANLLIGASMLQLQEYNAQRTKLMEDYFREKKTLKGFGDYADQRMGTLFPKIATAEEAAKLRPGTVYKGPDGKYRVRRSIVPGTE